MSAFLFKTEPGTYSYVCLVHPKMGGVVKVT